MQFKVVTQLRVRVVIATFKSVSAFWGGVRTGLEEGRRVK